MASYNEVLGVLREYRNELENQIQQESTTALTASGPSPFAARGGVSAFSTPLTNVHATGVGVRVKNGKIIADDFVIKVYVFDKMELGARTPGLTKDFQGVGVDVESLPIQMALARALKKKAAKAKPFAATTIAQHRSRQRPIVGGVSIAPLNEAFVGTLGCFLQRTTGGTRQIFALSNNHVMADTNRLPIGTSIVQPGPELGPSGAGDIFAALSAFIPIQFPTSRLNPVTNVFDAAISIVANESLIKISTQLGIEKYTPKVGVPVPGMRVIKSGRTTGVTTGMIRGTRVNGVQVNYGTQNAPRIATFNDTMQITGDGGRPFSMPGDSGSVILDQATGQPVGLLFAGDGQSTFACDLAGVCKQFQAFPL